MGTMDKIVNVSDICMKKIEIYLVSGSIKKWAKIYTLVHV